MFGPEDWFGWVWKFLHSYVYVCAHARTRTRAHTHARTHARTRARVYNFRGFIMVLHLDNEI